MDFWSTLTLIILIFLVILLIIDLLVVMLSYSMCWYEYANAEPQLMEKRFTISSLRLIFSITSQEVYFNLLTLLSFPFGLFQSRNQTQQAGETPILLLHGLFNNQASWFWLKRHLRKQGFNNIATINLSSWHNEEVLTELLAKKIDELRHRLGVAKVHLVCHSMGGMIARNYLQLRGGAGKIERCVFLGVPHLGSKLAPFALSPLGRTLIPGVEFLQRLATAPLPDEVKVTNIYSIKDNMVLPNANASLPWGESIELDRIGHTALIYRQPALAAVTAALKQGE